MEAATIGLTRVYDSPVAAIPNTWIRSGTGMTGGSTSDQEAESNGETRFQANGSMRLEGRTLQHAEADTSALTLGQTDTIGRATRVSDNLTEGYAFGITRSQSEERARSHTTSVSDTITEGVTTSVSREHSQGTSETAVPFITFMKKDVTLDVQYLSEDEQMNLKAQEILRMPNQCYFLQLATLPTRHARARDWRMPALSDEVRASDWLAIHQRPTYTPLKQIEAEERERLQGVAKGKEASGSCNNATPALAVIEQSSPSDLPPVADAALSAAPIEACPTETAPETPDRSRFRRPRTPPA